MGLPCEHWGNGVFRILADSVVFRAVLAAHRDLSDVHIRFGTEKSIAIMEYAR